MLLDEPIHVAAADELDDGRVLAVGIPVAVGAL
jgi:hypothetical protein